MTVRMAVTSIISRTRITYSLCWKRHEFQRCSVLISSIRKFGQPAAQTHPHLISEGEVTPGLNRKEFYRRRCQLVQSALESFKGVKSVNNHLFIFPSATTSYMTNDIPYIFRQNTDFLYLCGFQEPDSLLLIEAHSKSLATGEHTAQLFVPKKDEAKELWDGPRSGATGATMLTGVDSAFSTTDFEKYLQYYNKSHKDYVIWYNHAQPVHPVFHNSLISQVMQERRHKCVENSTHLIHRLRLTKSPAEIKLMEKSVDIASAAFIDVMKFSKPGINEAHLWAKMDFECRLRGAEFLAYPPVVAGGARANIIHYITNNQVIKDGDLVLMDAGCEYHGYTSDLTRTWPVSGRFSQAQKKLYNATLRVQEACIRMCTPNYSLDEIFNTMLHLIVAEMKALDIIPSDATPHGQLNIARRLCPHHVSHYLGMDVHDTSSISRRVKLQPGMIITIEPGIYIPTNDYSVSPEQRGIGIRIEDNILITDSEPVNLSIKCPKHVEEIESLMASSR